MKRSAEADSHEGEAGASTAGPNKLKRPDHKPVTEDMVKRACDALANEQGSTRKEIREHIIEHEYYGVSPFPLGLFDNVLVGLLKSMRKERAIRYTSQSARYKLQVQPRSEAKADAVDAAADGADVDADHDGANITGSSSGRA